MGKTSFAVRVEFAHRNMIPKGHTPTIGVEYVPCIVTVADPSPMKLKFQMWDTAGQERFASITRAYYKDAQLVCLVYSCDRPDTLAKLRTRWWPEIQASGVDLASAVILVLGNKADLLASGSAPLGTEALLRAHLEPLLEAIQRDTGGRTPTHVRVSALKDKTVVHVLEAVAWQCVTIPSVQRTKRTPDGRLVLGSAPPSQPASRFSCCAVS